MNTPKNDVRPRVLVIYYSQSGDVRRVAEALLEPLANDGVPVHWEELRPTVPFPWPWKNIHKFFYIMPDCLLGHTIPMETLSTEATSDEYDLVVLAYQVWFLAPSIPVQSFLQQPTVRQFLQGRNVMTLCVNRNMWNSASERMKRILAGIGANHVDNIVVTHQGHPLGTFITTTRRLFTGRAGKVMGVLSSAEVGGSDFDRMHQLGTELVNRQQAIAAREPTSFLAGLDTVSVNRTYVICELAAYYNFAAWAVILDAVGRVWSGLRHVGTFLFANFLLLMILTGIPVVLLGQWLLSPVINSPLNRYIDRLRAPSVHSLPDPEPGHSAP